jgi:hypothetical protein
MASGSACDDTPRLLADTPGILAFPVPLNDLYPMEIVTPGWFVGEAAYRCVAAELARRLG